MYVTDIALDNWRSYRSLVLTDLRPGVNILLGANGQGKTNLLEAINYVAVLGSHRVGVDAALIFRPVSGVGDNDAARAEDGVKDSANASRVGVVRIRLCNAGQRKTHSDLLEIEVVAGRANRARLNRHPVRPKEFLGHCTSVLFAPEDLNLVRGEPSTRRGFLDDLGVQLYPVLAAILAEYQKVARQRGAYLKALAKNHQAPDPLQLGIWDQALAPLAAQITWYRHRIVAALNEKLPGIYAAISASVGHVASLHYADNLAHTLQEYVTSFHPIATEIATETETETVAGSETSDLDLEELYRDKTALEQAFLYAFAARHGDEARRGVNLVGPHRDELELELKGFPVKGFASHGESWSFVLALRLAQFQLLRDSYGQAPLLMLDDVFAELDETRRRAVLEVIGQADQVWVTSALGTELPGALRARMYRVGLGDAQESAVQFLGEGPVSAVLARGEDGGSAQGGASSEVGAGGALGEDGEAAIVVETPGGGSDVAVD